MHGWGGACVAGGAYVVGGVHGRGHVWQRGIHGRGGMCGRGVCMAGGMRGRKGGMPARRDGHCSGRYASYWNAFLLLTRTLLKRISETVADELFAGDFEIYKRLPIETRSYPRGIQGGCFPCWVIFKVSESSMKTSNGGGRVLCSPQYPSILYKSLINTIIHPSIIYQR